MIIWLSLVCERCTQPFGATWKTRRFCGPCAASRFRDNGGTAAHYAVAGAIKRGELPPAKELVCVDCGAQARDYDHRDYSKLLEVDPVCRSCNRKRGPAIFNFANDAIRARYFAGKQKAEA